MLTYAAAASRWRKSAVTVLAAILSAVFSGCASVPVVEGPELTPIGAVFDADLEDPRRLTISPDDRHLYATTSWRNGAVVIYARDPQTGAMTHVQTLKNDLESVDGLQWPRGLACSPDGRNLYVASTGENGIAVLARDAASGRLTFVEYQGGAKHNALADCNDLTLSPDGAHLYAVGPGDNSMAVFARDAATGKLAFVEAHHNNPAGIADFDRPEAVAVTPDGAQVFVTTTGSNSLFIFDRNTNSGALTRKTTWRNGAKGLTGLVNPRKVIFTSDGAYAYIPCGGFGIVAFTRNPETGALALLSQHKNGVGKDKYLSGLRHLALSPDESRLYCSARFGHALSVYERDIRTGTLSRLSEVRQGHELRLFHWPGEVVVSTGGEHAYVVAGEDSMTAIDLRKGRELSVNSQVIGAPGYVPGLRDPQKLTVSPDGSGVFVPASYNEDAISCFQRDPATGMLAQTQVTGSWDEWGPDIRFSHILTEIVVSDDGEAVYACASGSSSVAFYLRDPATNLLTFVEAYGRDVTGIDALDSPLGIRLSPDQKHLYVAAPKSNSVIAFERTSSGSLVFVDSYTHRVTPSLDHMNGPTDVYFSPNGSHLYVPAANSDSVVVFDRDRTTGGLTPASYVRNGMDGVSGLDCARWVLVSPDGENVYVGGCKEYGVVAFTRNKKDGSLSFLQHAHIGLYRSGRKAAMDSRGLRLYVPFEGANALAVFERMPETGLLRLVETVSANAPDNVDGMANPYCVAISPDDRHLYVGSITDDSVTIFKTVFAAEE